LETINIGIVGISWAYHSSNYLHRLHLQWLRLPSRQPFVEIPPIQYTANFNDASTLLRAHQTGDWSEPISFADSCSGLGRRLLVGVMETGEEAAQQWRCRAAYGMPSNSSGNSKSSNSSSCI